MYRSIFRTMTLITVFLSASCWGMQKELCPKLANIFFHCNAGGINPMTWLENEQKWQCCGCTAPIEERHRYKSMLLLQCKHHFHGHCWDSLPSFENQKNHCKCGEKCDVILRDPTDTLLKQLYEGQSGIIIQNKGHRGEAPLSVRIPYELKHHAVPLMMNIAFQLLAIERIYQSMKVGNVAGAISAPLASLLFHQTFIANIYLEEDRLHDPRMRICTMGRAALTFVCTLIALAVYGIIGMAITK